jgi:hypothetical protein
MKIIFIIISLSLSLLACSAKKPKTDDYLQHVATNSFFHQNPPPMSIRLPEQEPIDIRGAYDPNNQVQGTQILYSGSAGLGGMLVQVATHAAISNSQQNNKLSEQQIQANAVLLPIKAVYSTMTNKDLLFTHPQLSFNKTNSAEIYIIENKPIYFLSQDSRTLTLRNIVYISDPRQKPILGKTKVDSSLYQNIIEVTAMSLVSDKPNSEWQADNGALLKKTLQQLYIKSIDIALSDINGKLNIVKADETLSFAQGKTQRTERGKLLQLECEYSLIRNLRGWLIAVPSASIQNQTLTTCIRQESSTVKTATP